MQTNVIDGLLVLIKKEKIPHYWLLFLHKQLFLPTRHSAEVETCNSHVCFVRRSWISVFASTIIWEEKLTDQSNFVNDATRSSARSKNRDRKHRWPKSNMRVLWEIKSLYGKFRWNRWTKSDKRHKILLPDFVVFVFTKFQRDLSTFTSSDNFYGF